MKLKFLSVHLCQQVTDLCIEEITEPQKVLKILGFFPKLLSVEILPENVYPQEKHELWLTEPTYYTAKVLKKCSCLKHCAWKIRYDPGVSYQLEDDVMAAYEKQMIPKEKLIEHNVNLYSRNMVFSKEL